MGGGGRGQRGRRARDADLRDVPEPAAHSERSGALAEHSLRARTVGLHAARVRRSQSRAAEQVRTFSNYCIVHIVNSISTRILVLLSTLLTIGLSVNQIILFFRNDDRGDIVYLILRVVFRIQQPRVQDICLGKRIAVQILKRGPPASTNSIGSFFKKAISSVRVPGKNSVCLFVQTLTALIDRILVSVVFFVK